MKIRTCLLASLVAANAVFSLQANGSEVSLHTAFRYYRFSITKITGTSTFQISELALYDEQGNRVNRGLTNKGNVSFLHNDWVSRLDEPNSCVLIENGTAGVATDFKDALQNLFDGNLVTKSLANQCSNLDESNPATWPGVIMRLADDAAPVASYNIATADDNVWAEGTGNGRTVTGWALFGSHDGTTWAQLDLQPSPAPSVPSPITNQTWYNDGEAITICDHSGTAYFVQSGDTLSVAEQLAFGTVINNGTLSIASGATAAFDVASGTTNKLQGGALAGSGTLEKRGAGQLDIGGGDNSAFTGKIDAKAGTVRFLRTAAPTAFKYYRFCLKGKESNSDGGYQLSELALYDAAGNRVNLGLTSAGGSGNQYAAIGDMGASTYAFNKNGTTTWVGESGTQMTDKLFDGDLGTKLYGGNLTPSASSYPYLVMRLADNAAPVAAYNLATGDDTGSYPNRHIVSWSLEGSMDGQCWTVLDERTNDPGAVRANRVWYNNGRAYTVSRPLVSRKARYYRVCIKGKETNDSELFELSEIALYDASGNRLNLNMPFAGKLFTWPGSIAEGTFAVSQTGTTHVNIQDSGHKEGPEKLVDGDTSTKLLGWARPTASDYPWFVFRLAENAQPVAAYNIGNGTDIEAGSTCTRHVNTWSFECSDDGTNWTVLDESEAADPRSPRVNRAWFNEARVMPCTKNGTDGASMPTNATLAVASGATIELPTDQTGGIASLEIDCANGSGTIVNFTAASGMTLNLTNFHSFRDNTLATGKALPITLSGTVDISTIDTWTVLIDGDAAKATPYTVYLDNGVLMIRGMPATFIIMR